MPQTEGTRVPAAAATPIHGALTPRAETGGNRFVTRYDAIASHVIRSQTGHGLVALPRSSAGERASTEHVEQAPRVRRLLTHTHAYMRAQAHGRPHTRTTHANTHARSRTHTRREIRTRAYDIAHARAHTHTHRDSQRGSQTGWQATLSSATRSLGWGTRSERTRPSPDGTTKHVRSPVSTRAVAWTQTGTTRRTTGP